MKIRTDFNDLIPRRSGMNTPARNPQKGASPGTAGPYSVAHNNAVIERLGLEKTLGQALSIALMSQNVLSRALEISSRLRNIASEALAQGRVDSDALTQTVSEINVEMSSYNEYVPAPVHFNAAAQGVSELPDVDEDMNRLRHIAGSIRDGEIPGMKVFDDLEADIKTGLGNAGRAVSEISASLDSAYSPGDFNGMPAGLAGQTASGITEAPFTALEAQGNISADAVNRLL